MDIADKASTILNYAKDFSNTLRRLATFVTNKSSQDDMIKRGLINPSVTADEKSKIALQGSEVLGDLAEDAKLVLQQAHTLTKSHTLSTSPRPKFAPGTSSSSNEEND